LRRDIFRVLRRLLPLASFCALFLVQAAFNVIPLRSAFVFMLRMQCAALLCMALVAPSGMGNVAAALAAFRVSPKLISIIYLTYRYIFMMHDVVMCAVKAMRLRGGGGRGFAAWKCYAAVFAQALVTAIETADDVSAALATRGFDGVIPRTALWRWRVRDTMFAACAAVCAAAVFAAPSAKAFWGT
jgi:cobalt/nickel transport system permease protein